MHQMVNGKKMINVLGNDAEKEKGLEGHMSNTPTPLLQLNLSFMFFDEQLYRWNLWNMQL